LLLTGWSLVRIRPGEPPRPHFRKTSKLSGLRHCPAPT